MSGVLIKYGDIAVGAKEAMHPTANQNSMYSRIEQLKMSDEIFVNYGNPCEAYSVLLDNSVVGIPQANEEIYIGYISEDISGEDAAFLAPIELTFEAENYYTSSGITLTFDAEKNIHPLNVKVIWYRDEIEISAKDFLVDNSYYFFQNKVDFYNKVAVIFYDMNMPQNRLNVKAVQFGHFAKFAGDELKKVSLIQEAEALSAELSTNTCDFILESKKNVDYTFSAQQPIKVYFDDVLKAKTFVSSVKRNGKNHWSIQSADLTSVMHTTTFKGGMYERKSAVDLLKTIFETAKVPYFIEDVFASERVSGYIPYTDCRSALQQVAFAIGAMVDTSESEVVNVVEAQNDVSQTVVLERIMMGQNFDEQSKLTALEVTAHSYVPAFETVEAYSASNSGVGESIFVKFSEPLHSLEIVNGDILESGVNYAVINAREDSVLSGKKYDHTTYAKRKYNPLTISTDNENIVYIDNATLVSSYNIDKILDMCYDYYKSMDVVNLKIIEGKHIVKPTTYGGGLYGAFKYNGVPQIEYDKKTNVGQVIECETEYKGILKGRITRQKYNLNSGIIVKDTEMRLNS